MQRLFTLLRCEQVRVEALPADSAAAQLTALVSDAQSAGEKRRRRLGARSPRRQARRAAATLPVQHRQVHQRPTAQAPRYGRNRFRGLPRQQAVERPGAKGSSSSGGGGWNTGPDTAEERATRQAAAVARSKSTAKAKPLSKGSRKGIGHAIGAMMVALTTLTRARAPTSHVETAKWCLRERDDPDLAGMAADGKTAATAYELGPRFEWRGALFGGYITVQGIACAFAVIALTIMLLRRC